MCESSFSNHLMIADGMSIVWQWYRKASPPPCTGLALPYSQGRANPNSPSESNPNFPIKDYRGKPQVLHLSSRVVRKVLKHIGPGSLGAVCPAECLVKFVAFQKHAPRVGTARSVDLCIAPLACWSIGLRHAREGPSWLLAELG